MSPLPLLIWILGAGVAPAPISPLPAELASRLEASTLVAPAGDNLLALLDPETGELTLWTGESISVVPAPASLPFVPDTFSYDPTTRRLAIARRFPREKRQGSEIAVLESAKWRRLPDPRASIRQLVWAQSELHAAVTPCRGPKCSSFLSSSALTEPIPDRLPVWRSFDLRQRAWVDVASMEIPGEWREALRKVASPADGPPSIQSTLLEGQVRSLTSGFLIPAGADRMWFVSRGLPTARLYNLTGRLLAEYAVPEIAAQEVTGRVDGASGTTVLPGPSILGAAPSGSRVVIVARRNDGLALVCISPTGQVAVRHLPEGSQPSQVVAVGDKVLIGSPWIVLPMPSPESGAPPPTAGS